MGSDKMLSVTFDCGRAGRVTWEVPRDEASFGVKDDEAVRRLQVGFGPSVKKVFTLFIGILQTGDKQSIQFGYEMLDQCLVEIARLLLLKRRS